MSFDVEVDGADQTARALDRLPDTARASLRDRTAELSRMLVGRIQSAARSSSAQAAAVARTVDAEAGRMPGLTAGGTSRVTSSRVPAHHILFGAEFGRDRLPQFRRHRPSGYWLTPTVNEHTDDNAAVWDDVLDDVEDDWR